MKPKYGTVLRWHDPAPSTNYIVMALGVSKLLHTRDGFDALVVFDSEKLTRHGPSGRMLLDEGNVFSMVADDESWEQME